MQAAPAAGGEIAPDAHRFACGGAGQQGLQVSLAGLPVVLCIGVAGGRIAVRGEAEPGAHKLFAGIAHQLPGNRPLVQAAQQGQHIIGLVVYRDGFGTAAGLLFLGAALIKRRSQRAIDRKRRLLQRGFQRFGAG